MYLSVIKRELFQFVIGKIICNNTVLYYNEPNVIQNCLSFEFTTVGVLNPYDTLLHHNSVSSASFSVLRDKEWITVS